MAQTTLSLACTASAMVSALNSGTNYHTSSVEWMKSEDYYSSDLRSLLLSFSDFPDAQKYNLLYGAYVQVHVSKFLEARKTNISGYPLEAAFNENTVTWDTSPEYGSRFGTTALDSGSGEDVLKLSAATEVSGSVARTILRSKGVAIQAPSMIYPAGSVQYVTAYLRGAASGKTPTLVIVYDDTQKAAHVIAANNAPTSGYVNPRTATEFSWKYGLSSGQYCKASDFVQSSCEIKWRVAGASTYNTISVSGNSRTATVPANTFPTNATIEWHLVGTRDDGYQATSPTYSFSTAAALVTTTPISPVGSVEANDGPITFSWETSSADGFQPGTTALWWSDNGSTWHVLASVRGNQYTAPANTFPAGTVYWRASTYNIDGNPGPWSADVSFISFGAPAAPSVTVQAGAFAVINWQAQEQEAYRVTVDGRVYGPFFGTAKRYELADPLSIGAHVATVEVQNSFGLWSQPGTVTFNVEGNAYSPPTITSARFREDATISWTAVSIASTGALYVYRDGVKIASLDYSSGSGTFKDRVVLGTHSYQLVQKIGLSAACSQIVTGTCKSRTTRIAALAGGEWIELCLSENSQREEVFSRQRAVSLRHFSGADYPVAEIGPYQDGSGTYDVAFADEKSAAAFEVLIGKPVIVKSRGGNVVVGVLSGLEKRVKEFYFNYTFTIQRIYWRDYVDLTGN